jgi:hypothetical protein
VIQRHEAIGARDPEVERWREVVNVRPRYLRSVHLERDAAEQGALDGYIVTPLVRTLTGRVVEGFRAAAGARAWSVTGPYGTGKSAFALFLADVMSPPELDASRTARRLLARADGALASALAGPEGIFTKNDGLCPVLATGERRPLDQVLLRALRGFTQRFWSRPGAKSSIVAQTAKLADAAEAGRTVPVRDIVALFEQTAQKVVESRQTGRGILVVLDEAGKVLEHAAHHPERGDVQLLQEMAEAADRSKDAPLVFVVLLHQAFEQYAGRLSLTERGEWSKVQGRFVDLAFQEASHELLRLVGEALDRRALPPRVGKALEPLASMCAALVTRGGEEDAKRRVELLSAAFPLHPVTALLLGPLFRSRLAQNERSLFAFLASVEPFGFQEHLDKPIREGDRPVLFLPDALYDYIVTSLGSRLHGHLGKQWAQIEASLRRLPEGAGDLDARVLETIGLLGLFGDAAGVTASEAVLAAIYVDGSDASKRRLAEAVDRLRRASLIIFRKFRNAYQLWEGSDLDVDALVRDALGHVDATATLVQRLTRVAPPRPIVARRHLFETGTLRYLDLRYVDVSAFDEAIPDADPSADGSLLLVIEPDATARARFLHRLQQPMAWATAGSKPVIVAVPRHVGKLMDLGGELAALEWVQTHTPELHDDHVAQREVAGRLAEAERRLRDEIARLRDGQVGCDWLTRGREHVIGSARALVRLVSDLCDEAYDKAPVVQNELLNRRQLSSAAAAARRTLLEAMATNGSKPRLGFEGTPPEVSMYRSLLETHGLHRERDGGLGFGEPIDKRFGKRKSGSLKPVWAEIVRALRDAQEARLRVPELFERLRRPPYGLKDGILPVLLVAALLAYKDEMALYENGRFVPALTGAVIELLLHATDKFEVQRLSIEGPRAAVYGRMMEMLSTGVRAPLSGVVPIVRQLVRVVPELTDFARTTKTVSPRAQAVRGALQRAREPAPLLFHELPIACGRPPFEAQGTLLSADVDAFVEDLRAAVRELQLAYPKLLDAIEDAIRTGLSLPADSSTLRRELASRAERLLPVAVEAQLKAFLLRASDEDARREEWLVSLGTLLGGKPPESWHDRDMDQMRLTLGLLSRRFASLESMLIGPETSPVPADPALVRVAVAQPGQVEQERVVPLRPGDEALVASVCAQIRGLAESAAASLPREAIVAALALVTRDMIAELNGRGGLVDLEVRA